MDELNNRIHQIDNCPMFNKTSQSNYFVYLKICELDHSHMNVMAVDNKILRSPFIACNIKIHKESSE